MPPRLHAYELCGIARFPGLLQQDSRVGFIRVIGNHKQMLLARVKSGRYDSLDLAHGIFEGRTRFRAQRLVDVNHDVANIHLGAPCMLARACA